MIGHAIITPYLAAGLADTEVYHDQYIHVPDEGLAMFMWQLQNVEIQPWLLAFALLLVSVLVRTGTLRHILALLAGMVALALTMMGGPNPLGLTLSVLFIAANAFQLARGASAKRKGLLSDEERALIAEVLAIEEPAKQRRLRDVITWRDAETGEILIRQGQIAPPLIYIATGRMDIEHDGLPVGLCGPDDFIGEMSLISGEGASATVKVAMPARIAVFDRDGLQRLVSGMPELAQALDRTLNRGLSAKIQRMNKASSEKWNIGG